MALWCTTPLLRAARHAKSAAGAAAAAALGAVPKAARPAFLLLRVQPGTPPAEIKKQFRALVRKHHPDVNGGDDSKMKEVNDAYATVLRHLVKRAADTDASGDARPAEPASAPGARRAGDLGGKPQEERDLLHRLASWLREGQSPSEDPTTEYRSHIESVSEEELRLSTLGTAEDELAWAQRWLEEREERLARKNQWRVRGEKSNPFDNDAAVRLPQRLEELDALDTLYWRMPLVPPSPPQALLGGKSAPPRDMWLRRGRERQMRSFLSPGGGAERFARAEQREEAKRRREGRARDLMRKQRDPWYLPSIEVLEQAKRVHETKWRSMRPRSGPSDLIDNEYESRPPYHLRKGGQLMSFTSPDGDGKSRSVTVSKDVFESVGSAGFLQ